MTREEAIYRLKNTAWLGTDKDREETEQAIDMAIEALQALQGKPIKCNYTCSDCVHQIKAYEEEPCHSCFNNDGAGYEPVGYEPVKHGSWTITDTDDGEGGEIPHLICSECKSEPMAWSSKRFFNFCPNCGAKMDRK